MMEKRIRQLQHILDTAEVRDVEDTGTVQVGSVVTVVDGDGDPAEYLVAPQENKVPRFLLASPEAPRPGAQIGAAVGDDVSYKHPGFHLRIAHIRPAG